MNLLIPFKTRTLLLIVLVCFALLPTAQAQLPSPTPDGGYPGANTAEGFGALKGLTTGVDNTATGFLALFSVSTGSRNTATGAGALEGTTIYDGNTAMGFLALASNTTSDNTAIGSTALQHNNTGFGNTAVGFAALENSTTGDSNNANGIQALFNNTTGFENTATGAYALFDNTTAGQNTATGYQALFSNTTGLDNTATGTFALFGNTTGLDNTASGFDALGSNTTGSNNTAYGAIALLNNTTGGSNTASGVNALLNNAGGSYNTAMGVNALLNNIGSSNVGLGTNAGRTLTTGSGNVCIGVNVFGVAGESNTTRIRNIYSSVASGRAVFVNSDNKIGTLASSRRFKEEIKPMDRASETLLALKPVTFRYKKEVDPAQALSFGLIAEEVAEVNPELVTRDETGKPQTVRYEAVNAMLLNEFLKEHKVVKEQQATIAELKSTVAQQQKSFQSKFAQQDKRIEALTSGLQKVSAQVELNKPAPHTIANNQ